MDNRIDIRLELTKQDAMEEESAGKINDYELKEIEPIPSDKLSPLVQAPFVEPVTAIVVITLAVVAKRLIDHWLKSKERGVQVDLRETPPIISRIAGVPFGFIVVINKDNKVETYKADYTKSEDIMPLLTSLFEVTQ